MREEGVVEEAAHDAEGGGERVLQGADAEKETVDEELAGDAVHDGPKRGCEGAQEGGLGLWASRAEMPEERRECWGEEVFQRLSEEGHLTALRGRVALVEQELEDGFYDAGEVFLRMVWGEGVIDEVSQGSKEDSGSCGGGGKLFGGCRH